MVEHKLRIYPWSISATDEWGEDSGLKELREYADGTMSVDQMVDMLWPAGGFVQNVAVAEFLAHGNVRQAAVFVRRLLEKYPVCRKTLEDSFGDLVHEFLTTPPEQYPSRPGEYPLHVQIVYV